MTRDCQADIDQCYADQLQYVAGLLQGPALDTWPQIQITFAIMNFDFPAFGSPDCQGQPWCSLAEQ
jgi:hypothetical protein